MIQTLSKNWWLLAVCGVLNAMVSAIYLFMQDQDVPLTLRAFKGTLLFQSDLILAAGACMIAVGLWRSAKGKCWLVVLNGLALLALGLIGSFGFGNLRISFRTIALLFVVMAASIGALELLAAQTLRGQRHAAGEWILGLAGAASVGFALTFFALAFSWMKIDLGSHYRSLAEYMWWKADFLWFGVYFGFTAICLLGLALSLHRPDLNARRKPSPLPSPELVH